MEQIFASAMASEIRISVDRIVREEREMEILRLLAESPIASILVFRGGTALRLAFGSPRFSDDLDFSLRKEIQSKVFFGTVENIARALGEGMLSDMAAKRVTYLAEFKFTEPWLRLPFSVKIEISRRPGYARSSQYDLRLLSSPITNIQVLFNVAALEKIREEKLNALKGRKEPRDLFDLWFVCQKMKIEMPASPRVFEEKILRRELKKYLPSTYWQAIDSLASSRLRRGRPAA